jgi:hypothetical protein
MNREYILGDHQSAVTNENARCIVCNSNLQMVLNNNNDISEFWEWPDKGSKSMHDASTSLEFGINYLMYAMTH